MPTLNELNSRVRLIIQDDSPDILAAINSYINEGIEVVAANVLLPLLEESAEIDTLATATEIDIPSSWNYDRNLYYAESLTNEKELEVYSSEALFAREYPKFRAEAREGPIEAVTEHASKLVYYPIAAETLLCKYYKKPTLLVEGTDTPSYIPSHLQYRLLVSYVAGEIFSMIEDGVDGAQVNTQFHMSRFQKALEDLDEYFRAGRSRPEPIRGSDWI